MAILSIWNTRDGAPIDSIGMGIEVPSRWLKHVPMPIDWGYRKGEAGEEYV
jgi:hypothetical protein